MKIDGATSKVARPFPSASASEAEDEFADVK
jgi:hypothetical protein